MIRGTQPRTRERKSVWKGGDVFVLPANSEAFGAVFQEAAAAGLPAIGTRLNAIPEIVLDGETGLLIPPGDARALGVAMVRLVESRERCLSPGSKARARMLLNCSTNIYATKLVRIVDKIARVHENRLH